MILGTERRVLSPIAGWIAGGGVLAGAAGLILGQTLFAPTHELHYSGGVSAAFCLPAERGGTCTFIYTLSLGNTGKAAQAGVHVSWPLDMRGWSFDAQVADIVASARPTARPKILPTFAAERTTCDIEGLMPNTVVDLKIRCLACSAAQLAEMRAARATVEARGSVSESDPRVSALRGAVTNFLRVLGLLR